MTYVTYTASGPFNPGGPPGISSTFLNNVEAFLATLWSDSAMTSDHAGGLTVVGLIIGSGLLNLAPKSSVVKNGSTSGTMVVREFFTGSASLKLAVVDYQNYRNAAASANTIALSAAFTKWAVMATGDTPGTQVLASASPVTIGAITSLGSTGAGTLTNTTKFAAASIGFFSGAFDSVSEPGSNASAHTGQVFILGV